MSFDFKTEYVNAILTAGKSCGAGLATIGLAGAGVGVGIVFGFLVFALSPNTREQSGLFKLAILGFAFLNILDLAIYISVFFPKVSFYKLLVKNKAPVMSICLPKASRYNGPTGQLPKKYRIFLKDPFFPVISVILSQPNILRILPLIGKKQGISDNSRFFDSANANRVAALLIFLLIIFMHSFTHNSAASAKTSVRGGCSIYRSLGYVKNNSGFKNYSAATKNTTSLDSPSTQNTKINTVVGEKSPKFFENQITKNLGQKFQENMSLGNSSNKPETNLNIPRNSSALGTPMQRRIALPGDYQGMSIEEIVALYPKQGIIDSNPLNTPVSQEHIQFLLNSQESVEQLGGSLYFQQGISHNNNWYAILGQTHIQALKQGIPPETAALLTGLAFGFAGKNFTLFQFISTLKGLKGKSGFMNMEPYRDPEEFKKLPPNVQHDVNRMPLGRIMQYFEIITQQKMNNILIYPLNLFMNKNGKIRFTDGGANQNLSGNPCPDFTRTFPKAISNVLQEAFDPRRKPMYPLNHRRTTASLVALSVNNAEAELRDRLDSKAHLFQGLDKTTYEEIIHKMDTFSGNFEKTRNIAQYLFSYNTLRDQHLEFFIRNRISMNLIHHVGIQHIYGVSPESHKIYNQLFVNNYYSPLSQWYQYKHNGVKNAAGVVENQERVLLEFFEYIWNTPN